MTAEKKVTFEKALSELEKASDNLKKDDITLEEALQNFEDGVKHYNQCSEILNKAKQKIETYSK